MVGSGRSTPSLIKYLGDELSDYKILIADQDTTLAEKNSSEFDNCSTIKLDIEDDEGRDNLVRQSALVLSMVPARFHAKVLESCLKFGKSMITPSYESRDMLDKRDEIEAAQGGNPITSGGHAA